MPRIVCHASCVVLCVVVFQHTRKIRRLEIDWLQYIYEQQYVVEHFTKKSDKPRKRRRVYFLLYLSGSLAREAEKLHVCERLFTLARKFNTVASIAEVVVAMSGPHGTKSDQGARWAFGGSCGGPTMFLHH